MRVRILDSAERDLEKGYRFYERQSHGLGAYFLDSLYSDIDSLTYFGGIHRADTGTVLLSYVLSIGQNSPKSISLMPEIRNRSLWYAATRSVPMSLVANGKKSL